MHRDEIQAMSRGHAKIIRKNCHTGDTERDHGVADGTVVEFLRLAGYTALADAFENVNKWYA